VAESKEGHDSELSQCSRCRQSCPRIIELVRGGWLFLSIERWHESSADDLRERASGSRCYPKGPLIQTLGSSGRSSIHHAYCRYGGFFLTAEIAVGGSYKPLSVGLRKLGLPLLHPRPPQSRGFRRFRARSTIERRRRKQDSWIVVPSACRGDRGLSIFEGHDHADFPIARRRSIHA